MGKDSSVPLQLYLGSNTFNSKCLLSSFLPVLNLTVVENISFIIS